MKALLIICFCFFLNVTIYAQTENFSHLIKEGFLNKKQMIKTLDGKEEIVYLGKIKDKSGKLLFYILSVYSEVQAAIVIHGHSRIIYLDKNKVAKRQFELGSPNDLPFKLQNNKLFFYYLNAETNKKKLFVNTVGEKIPKLLCVAPNDCY